MNDEEHRPEEFVGGTTEDARDRRRPDETEHIIYTLPSHSRHQHLIPTHLHIHTITHFHYFYSYPEHRVKKKDAKNRQPETLTTSINSYRDWETYSEEHQWRRRLTGQVLTLRCESVGSKQD